MSLIPKRQETIPVGPIIPLREIPGYSTEKRKLRWNQTDGWVEETELRVQGDQGTRVHRTEFWRGKSFTQKE